MGATWLSCFPRFDRNGNEEAEFKDVHMLESVAEEKVTKYTITTEGNTEWLVIIIQANIKQK